MDFAIQNTNRPSNYDTLVADFLNGHVDYMADKGGSRLEFITVRIQEAHPTLIAAIRELKCLTSFHLFTTNLAKRPFMQLLSSLCERCQNLRILRIVHDGEIPNRVLYYIGGLSNLRSLTISGRMGDVQAGVLSLQRCRHLKKLSIDVPIDPDIRSMLLSSNHGLDIARK
ncbi:predicted protein [Lichtheimia corymbifera JMRC:FSU:9682]|uniref:F-box domain-containing protein n=1 Tax=Lichtheimia corymbifera JMRC:FSU:9682 TaxID=1263082 RepID=A0A068S8X8_9FUNG|nr:predicted protein [Lichtheimia corymbifera JMRC:FSU:9682]